MKQFATIDWIVFLGYASIIVFTGLWVSRSKKGEQKSTSDYFLAGRSLPWWTIGAALLAANISAEHFIAMSGSGYAVGLAIAAYEWIAAIVLIFVAKYFLPASRRLSGLFCQKARIRARSASQYSSSFANTW